MKINFKKLFKKEPTTDDKIIKTLEIEKLGLSVELSETPYEDEQYDLIIGKIDVLDDLIHKREVKKSKKSLDPVVISAVISTLGFVGIALASMKYEDDGNIIQHVAGRNAMNKLGK